MGKKIMTYIAVLAIIAVATFNLSFHTQSGKLSNISLINVEALAEEGQNAQACPGGYCSYTNSYGNKCEACAPTGKNPSCTAFGCTCN